MSPKICIPVYVSSWQRLSGLGHEVPHDAANSDRILESERSLFLEGMHLHVIELMVYETTTSCVSMGATLPPLNLDFTHHLRAWVTMLPRKMFLNVAAFQRRGSRTDHQHRWILAWILLLQLSHPR